jgi:hypothetical protein
LSGLREMESEKVEEWVSEDNVYHLIHNICIV